MAPQEIIDSLPDWRKKLIGAVMQEKKNFWLQRIILGEKAKISILGQGLVVDRNFISS